MAASAARLRVWREYADPAAAPDASSAGASSSSASAPSFPATLRRAPPTFLLADLPAQPAPPPRAPPGALGMAGAAGGGAATADASSCWARLVSAWGTTAMTSPPSLTTGRVGMTGVPSEASNASGASATSDSETLVQSSPGQVLDDAPGLQAGALLVDDQAVRRTPDRRLGDVTDLQIVLASVERHDHVLQVPLVLGLGVGRDPGDRLRGRRRRIAVHLQRERRRPHRAAAAFQHRERREEVADLVLADLELDAIRFDPPAALEVPDAVAVDDHLLEGQAGRGDGRRGAPEPTCQQEQPSREEPRFSVHVRSDARVHRKILRPN